jgi:hypothetical protein
MEEISSFRWHYQGIPRGSNLTTWIKFCLWMILINGLMDAIKHTRKLDDMNHDSHLDPWMSNKYILFHACNNYEFMKIFIYSHYFAHMVNFIQVKTYNICISKFSCIDTISSKKKFHWCESHVISWIISMAKCLFAFKLNPSNMCNFNWYILLLRFIFIHVSYFIMHGVKSHSFDNFPSFCFSFSSCPLFGELAKNIGYALQGVMAH